MVHDSNIDDLYLLFFSNYLCTKITSMKKINSLLIFILCASPIVVDAQIADDTLRSDIRNYASRNFSDIRTFNLYWETSPESDYTFKSIEGREENGRIFNKHNVKFAVNLPLLQVKRFSLYAKGRFNFYKFETINDDGNSSNFLPTKSDGYTYSSFGFRNQAV